MRIVGHRGAMGEAPENTLAGIERALAAGADGVEIDVRRSADGALVVIHDETVDRTTDGSGRVDRMPLPALRRLDAGGGEPVPTLAEALAAVGSRGELLVEVKDPACAADAARAILEAGAADRCVLKCFDHRVLRAARAARAAGAPRRTVRTACLLVARPVDPLGLARAAGADVLSVAHEHVDEDLVAACREGGVDVCAWTCNSAGAARAFRAMGVAWLVTDLPSALVATLRG